MSSPTFNPGSDLVGRYRIVEFLGAGHTAEVYCAQDLSLNRTVVVKVLLAHLGAHEDVRRAFRDHIVSAATLNHPHVARVFDGGQQSGSIFMVTEYLTGGSLEDVLASGRRLNVDDVARLGRDASAALSYVHQNGFVHGSLSPSKLLFDDQGHVRVSDIALAGLGAAYREPQSLDDVRYLSPEQVLGETIGPKTDVYSLALILFEGATGTTPFEGLTLEAALRNRVNSPLPVRPELGALDMLLAQAAVPDPRLRLDAEQFGNRLGATVSGPNPLVVLPVSRDVPLLAQFAVPEARSSVGFRPPSTDQIVGATAATPIVTRQFPSAQLGRHVMAGSAHEDGFSQSRSSAARGIGDLPLNRSSNRRRFGYLLAAILIALVAVGGGAAWKMGLFSAEHSVPSLETLTVAEASNALQGYGFTLTIGKHLNSSTVPLGEIISQNPAKGTKGKAGLVIVVALSKGSATVTLPTNLVGSSCASVTAQLARLKLTGQCPSSAAVASSHTPAGRIAEILYHKTKNPVAVPIRSTLILALSTGPAGGTTTTTAAPTTTTTTTIAGQGLRALPNVVGMSQAQVKAAMHLAQLYYRTQGPGANSPSWTKVVSSVPAAGTMVAWHSTIILNVQ